ncbi:hypothetical protein SSX86_015595 [Deinandra increscens subsp. villosa]|uniref:Bulb-type lectin domain-containing protein n=1 Tax=Deinandra increscens subsp. villosa TaxID=3103831 RepID=A0AAP0GZ73_9ASTR
MEKLHFHATTIIFIIFFLFFRVLSLATDTITPTKPLTVNQTLVSSGQVFELGFFNPGNGNWYIGIWYKQFEQKTYVCVANRDTPINSSSGKLTIGNNGNIILVNEAETAVWTSNISVPVRNTVAQLLDSGNFVLRLEHDENPENYVWESFKNPTDTLLPGMKLGWDWKTGVNRFLQSWKTVTDPGSGEYSFKMNIDGFPEIFLLKNETGMKKMYRTGPWNGLSFGRVSVTKNVSIIEFKFVDNADQISYSFEMKNTSVRSRLVMSSSGSFQRFIGVVSSQTWTLFWSVPRNLCDNYRRCGLFGVCDANATPLCKCMKGFRPKNQQ